VSILTAEHIYRIWCYNYPCMIDWYYYSHWSWMKDSSINSQWHIRISIGGWASTKLAESLLDDIFITLNTTSLLHCLVVHVFTFEVNKLMWYHFLITYAYLDKWTTIDYVVSISRDSIWNNIIQTLSLAGPLILLCTIKSNEPLQYLISTPYFYLDQ
jgi:hypothetical protein